MEFVIGFLSAKALHNANDQEPNWIGSSFWIRDCIEYLLRRENRRIMFDHFETEKRIHYNRIMWCVVDLFRHTEILQES